MKARAYWNANLDTDNLSGGPTQSADAIREAMEFAASPDFEWARRQLGDMTGRTLVDLGGGIGMHALLWARAGARVVVVDPAEQRLATLRRVARAVGLEGQLRLVAGVGETLPLRGGSVDAVFTKSVLIHTDLRATTRDIRRVLKPNGKGVFIEPLTRNPIIGLYRRLFAPAEWKSITRYFDDAAIEDLREPFGRIRVQTFYLTSAAAFFFQYGWRGLERWRGAMRRLGRLDRGLIRRFPGLAKYSWFVGMLVTKNGG